MVTRSASPGAARTRRSPGLVRARAVLLILFSVEMAVLVVTGITLFFEYRPSVAQSWSDVAGVSDGWDVAVAVRAVHRLIASLAVWTSVVLAVVMVSSVAGRRAWPGRAAGVGLAVTTVAASFTGYLLPWDQLALWAVKAGTSTSGFLVLFDSDTVRFVLIGGTEVGRATFVRWLLVHTVVLGPVVVGLLALAWRGHRTAPVTEGRAS